MPISVVNLLVIYAAIYAGTRFPVGRRVTEGSKFCTPVRSFARVVHGATTYCNVHGSGLSEMNVGTTPRKKIMLMMTL